MIDHIDGMRHEVKGTLKERLGQATHDRSQQASGAIERHAGKAEQMIAHLNERLRRDEDRR
jgi:uncharacterized protein YjbJ (UPF0337 family)